jgi:Tol biopolymer transport system component
VNRLWVIIVLLVAEFLSCAKSGDPISPDISQLGLKGRLVFQLGQGSMGICVVDFGATPIQPRIVVPGGFEPRPTRDGTTLAFWLNMGNQLFTSNLDGSNAAPILTLTQSYVNWPDWSPDGSHILFENMYRGRPKEDLVLVDRSGGNWSTIVDTLTVARAFLPRWSPDGALIAFFGQDSLGGAHWLSTVAPNGSLYQRRAEGNGWWLPEWSPDSRRIVYAGSKRGQTQQRSFIFDVFSGVVSEVGAGSVPIRQATWLPDGRLICWDVSTLYLAGREPPYVCQTLLGGFSEPPYALGSPDSMFIGIFGRRGGDDLKLLLMKADGIGLYELTISSGTGLRILEDEPPMWVR